MIRKFYSQVMFPWGLDKMMSKPHIMDHRRQALEQVRGNTLEIGVGTGLNLPCYPEQIKQISTVDVNEGMNRYLKKRIQNSSIKVEFHLLTDKSLPFDSGTFDSVVSTWTLCSIPDVEKALGEIRRVLKTDGKFHFLEHGLSCDEKVRKWQRRLNPLQKIFADGCRLNLPIKELIRGSGFEFESIREFYLEKEPKFVGYHYQGIAVRV